MKAGPGLGGRHVSWYAGSREYKRLSYMEIARILGRVAFGAFFLMNAYSHFSKSAAMAGYAASKGVPSSKAAVIGTGVLLLAGGLSYVTGLYMFYGGLALVVFFLGVIPMMHAFWKEKDPNAKMMEMIQFSKDTAILSAVRMTM